MTARPAAVDDLELRRLDLAIGLLTGGLTVISLSLVLEPRLSPALVAPELNVAINVGGTLVGAVVAVLAGVRWRETRDVSSLHTSSAFVVLTLTNALISTGAIAGPATATGPTGSAQTFAWTLARAIAALLLVTGAVRGLRRTSPGVRPLVLALAPGIVVLVTGLVLIRSWESLPSVVGAADLVDSARAAGSVGSVDLVVSAVLVAIQVVVFSLFIVAALLFRRLFARERVVSQAFLSAGLVVAAFSQLDFAIGPVPANTLVTSADVLRVGFNAVLFLGIQADLQAELRSLRRANVELRRLREVDTANAALAERARLAREIHDGLAQDLWRAKLKQSAVEQAPNLDEASRRTAREVTAALDSALAEARQAVMAMRTDPVAGSTLAEVLRQYVDDFSDRFGVRSVFEADERLPRLSPRTEAEVLRIVQEALNNARKHSDATVIRVRAERAGRCIRLTVADNGRGFDPETVPADRYGLVGMRERAALVGASLAIVAAPSDGTRVSVEVPVDTLT
jgi:signal transduction histidine kinase